MAVTLGAKPDHDFDQPLGLLSDCHRRIERFLDAMIVAIERSVPRGGELGREERDALDAALKYFREAAPRHTRDEEESLFPRMRSSRNEAARQAIARIDALEADHRRADAMHAEVARQCQRWLDAGPLPGPELSQLKQVVTELRNLYARHIAVEDNEVFPLAQRVLSDAELAQVGREMANRRGIGPRLG